MKAFKERKRKHDDTHWPNWSSHSRISKSQLKKFPFDTNPMWLIKAPGKDAHKLGRFQSFEIAVKAAAEYGCDPKALIFAEGPKGRIA